MPKFFLLNDHLSKNWKDDYQMQIVLDSSQ